MSRCFCPGHVSCVFQPFSSLNPLATGSRGFGIRLTLGAHCEVKPREDSEIRIIIDGTESEAPVTRLAAEALCEGMGFDVAIDNDLPVSQGFGMSAAGALSAAVCIASETGHTVAEAVEAAHIAEINGGGGLGDVAAIAAGRDLPVRTVPGIPPYGRVENVRGRMDGICLAVLGSKIITSDVLSDADAVKNIRSAADSAIESFLADRTLDSLYRESNVFSKESGIESREVTEALEILHSYGYRAAMCMLGNSIFTDAPAERTRALLGIEKSNVYSCGSCRDDLNVTRTE